MIYVIQVANGGPFKVGFSNNPEQRLLDLQTASPHDLQLLGTREGDEEAEGTMHARLAAHHLRGEWFTPTDKAREIVLAKLGIDVAPTRETQVEEAHRRRCEARRTEITALQEQLLKLRYRIQGFRCNSTEPPTTPANQMRLVA